MKSADLYRELAISWISKNRMKLKLVPAINKCVCHHKNCRSVVGPQQPVTLSLSYGLYIGDKWASDQNYRTCYKSIIASSQTKPVIFYIQHHLWPISHHTSLKEKLSTLIHTIFSFCHGLQLRKWRVNLTCKSNFVSPDPFPRRDLP